MLRIDTAPLFLCFKDTAVKGGEDDLNWPMN